MSVQYTMYDFPNLYWIISLTTSTNSFWTFGFCHINKMRQLQGLIPQPIFSRSGTLVCWSVNKVSVEFIMKNIPNSYCFCSWSASTNSIGTFGFWYINQAKKPKGLVLDPDFLRIRDISLLLISGNVSPIHHVVDWLISPNLIASSH